VALEEKSSPGLHSLPKYMPEPGSNSPSATRTGAHATEYLRGEGSMPRDSPKDKEFGIVDAGGLTSLSLSPFLQGLTGEDALVAVHGASLWETTATGRTRDTLTQDITIRKETLTEGDMSHAPYGERAGTQRRAATQKRTQPELEGTLAPAAKTRHSLSRTGCIRSGRRASPGSSEADSDPQNHGDKVREIQRRKRLRERERRESMRTKYNALIELLRQGRRNLMSWDLYRRQRSNRADIQVSAGKSLDESAMPHSFVIPSDKDAVLSECMGQLNAFNRLMAGIREEFDTLHHQLDEMRSEKADLRNDKLYLREEVQRLRDEVRRLREGTLQMFLASRKGDMVADGTLEAALRNRIFDSNDEQLDLLLDPSTSVPMGSVPSGATPQIHQERDKTSAMLSNAREGYSSYGKCPDNSADEPDYSTCA
jgi:hypothetical protein